MGVTAKDIIERIGRSRIKQMLGVGDKSVTRAATHNRFTPSWYRAIKEELAELDEPPPEDALFNFKDRIGSESTDGPD